MHRRELAAIGRTWSFIAPKMLLSIWNSPPGEVWLALVPSSAPDRRLLRDTRSPHILASAHRNFAIFSPSAFARSLMLSSLRVRALAICFSGMPFLARVWAPALPMPRIGVLDRSGSRRSSRAGGGVRSVRAYLNPFEPWRPGTGVNPAPSVGTLRPAGRGFALSLPNSAIAAQSPP